MFYINGSTGPKVSNLMLQQMITSNGGRFAYVPFSPSLLCTGVLPSCDNG